MKKTFFCLLMLLFGIVNGQKLNLLPDTITLCEGDSASIEVRHDLGSGSKVKWMIPGATVENTRRIKASREGKYFIEVRSPSAPGGHTDSAYVKVLRMPKALMEDTFFCAGTRLALDAGNPGMQYLWRSGERSQKIKVNREGVYWVKISNGRCFVYDTVTISMTGVANPLQQAELTFCLSETKRVLTVRTGADAGVTWSTGARTPTINAAREGTYAVTVYHRDCPEIKDTIRVKFRACDCEILIPNSFTPNEDNRNDYFFPVLSCEYSYFNLNISDRWGNVVFETNNPSDRWDGRYKGNLCPEDIYVFILETTEKLTGKKDSRKGHISLFR